jgi:hypothetical protein
MTCNKDRGASIKGENEKYKTSISILTKMMDNLK